MIYAPAAIHTFAVEVLCRLVVLFDSWSLLFTTPRTGTRTIAVVGLFGFIVVVAAALRVLFSICCARLLTAED